MASKTRRYSKYLFLILAVISALIGFVTVTLWNRVLTPDLYTDALDQANFYRETTAVLEAQVTFYLEEKGKEIVTDLVEKNVEEDDEQAKVIRAVTIWVMNTVIENQTGNVVSSISQELRVEENIEAVFERSLTATLAWARGDLPNPQIFTYIPSVEEVEALGEQDNVSVLLSNLAYRAFGLNDLETCSSDAKEVEALTQVSEGNWREVSCTTDKVEEALVAQVEELLPKDAIEELRNNLDERFELYRIETLIDGMYEILLSVSQLVEDLEEFRTEIQAIRYLGIGLIFLSAIFTTIAVFLAEKRSLKTVLRVYLVVGLAMMAWSLVFNTFGIESLTNRIDAAEWTLQSDAISTSQALLLEKSVESTILYVAEHVHDYTIEIGFMLVLFMGIPLLLWEIYDRGGKEKGQEVYGEVESATKNAYESAKNRF